MSSKHAVVLSLSQREHDVFKELKKRLGATTLTGMARRLVEAEAGRNKWTDLVTILQDERVRVAEMLRARGKIGGTRSGVTRRERRGLLTRANGGR